MSRTIDEKIVEMRFDNRNFESNVHTSIDTIEKLKKSLNLTGANQGIEELNDSVHGVSLKFNAMYTIADQALRNITNSAMAAGKKIVSALTIDPVKTGFSEYETQINAVQTILANTKSKGTTLEDVNNALDTLNTYADKTIYNFTEMTRNIGTFTAAGVDLDTSVSAIQGIANLAAVSGSTSQQASTAMYQLSQALSSGTVKLMDWNSVVNAGMGGQVFQDALKNTARIHGVAIDDMISKEGSFRETLKNGWLTSEILTETLKNFTLYAEKGSKEWEEYKKSLKEKGYTDKQAEEILEMGKTATEAATKVKTFTQLFDTLKEAAQSGWTQTWEILVGDFEEAKELLTNISNVVGDFINRMSEARNEMLENWKVMGGRKDLLEGFKNIFEGLISVIKPIGEAFREIFPPMTAERLFAITENFKNLTANFKMGDTTTDKLKRTFKGLFAAVDIVIQLFKGMSKLLGPIFRLIGKVGSVVLEVAAYFGDWIVSIDQFIKKSGMFNTLFTDIGSIIDHVTNLFSKFIGFVKEKIVSPGLEIFHGLLERLHERLSSVGEAASDMKDGLIGVFSEAGSALSGSALFKVFDILWNAIKTISSGVVKIAGTLIDALAVNFSNGNLQELLDLINSLIGGGIGIALYKFIDDLKAPFEGLADILEGVKDVLVAWQMQIKAQALMKIAGAVAVLALALLLISTISAEKIESSLGAITTLFIELMIAMAIFSKLSGGLKGVFKATHAMQSIATAILIMAIALKVVSGMEFSEMMTGLVAIAGLMGVIIGASVLLSKFGGKIKQSAIQMILFASAIAILASVCKSMAELSWEGLAKGLVGVTALMGIIVGSSVLLSKFGGKIKQSAIQMVLFAAAIKIMASACEDFSYINWEGLAKGVAAIAILLAEIALFTKLSGNAKHVISTGLALIAISAAIKIFASAMQDFGAMSWESIAKGLVGMAGALAAIVAALHLMPKNLLGKGVGLVVIASALLILLNVLTTMGNASWESIAKGLVTLGGAMLILAAGLHAMNGTLVGTAALLVAVAALNLLVPVLSILGAMSWGGIIKSLVALAGAFAIMGLAGYLLGPVVPIILSLAGSFALIGLGAVALGAGITAVAIGLGALGGSIGALLAGIVSGLAIVIMTILELIPAIVKIIGDFIVELCNVLIKGLPAIGDALIALILMVCDVLIECLPAIVDVCLNLIVKLLDSLVQFIPKIVDVLFDFIIGILDCLVEKMPILIQKIVDVFMSIFSGVVDALGNIDVNVLIKGLAGIGLMAGLMAVLAAVASLIPMAMVGVLGMGLVIAELAIVLGAIGLLAQIPGLEWLITEGGYFLQTIGTAIGQFIGGIAGGIAKGFTGSLPDMANDLSEFMDNLKPFIEGASMIDASVVDGVKSLVGVVLAITGANLIEGITSWLTGDSSISTFAEELPTLGEGLKKFSDSVSGVNPENIIAASNAAKALAEMTSIIPNEGGVVGWFAGENSMAKFGEELPVLGAGLRAFSVAVTGIVPENITAAAESAKVLAEMTSTIPNEGGIKAWFSGAASISKFSREIIMLGVGLKGFSNAIQGVVPENISAAANAAKALAEMTSHIPNEGGIKAWFSGESSIITFANRIPKLGEGLKGFSDAVTGIVPENVTAGAKAAKLLAEMTAIIPNEGGIKAWFSGESSITTFANRIPKLGKGLKGFSEQVTGIVPENVTAGANAAKTLAEMTAIIPNEGGIKSWFSGDASITSFADKLPKLGKGLKGFSDEVTDIKPDQVTSAAGAAKALAEMTSVIPNEGGIKAWFTGDASISKFADKLPSLGKGLKGFSDSVAGISPENVTAAANAAKSLGQMTDTIPKNTDKIISFGDNLKSFGSKLKEYFKSTSGISGESITASNNAIKAIKDISNLNVGNITSTSEAIDNVIKSIKNLAKVPKDSASNFKKALEELGKTGAKSLLKPFEDIEDDMSKAGKKAMDKLIDGIEAKESAVKKAAKKIAGAAADAISDKKTSFYNAGRDLVSGLANGISENSYKAEAKARAMAKAAAKAAEKALDINSPSKVFRAIGKSIPEGLALGIDIMSSDVDKASINMAKSAVKSARESLSRITDIISNDIDAQPTIRPVIDLSDVKSGASYISGILNSDGSIGVSANVGAISSMMNRRNQNGGNADVVSAIDKLNDNLGKVGNTYNSINGVSYNDGGDIEEAIKTLVRAVIVEGRV